MLLKVYPFFEFLKSTVTLDHPARSAEDVPSRSLVMFTC